MEIKHRIYNNTFYVMLCGELDEHTAVYVSKTLDDLFTKNVFKQIIIDLSELEFMDSTGIGVIVGRYKKHRPNFISFVIKNPNRTVDRILKMTGIYTLIPKLDAC